MRAPETPWASLSPRLFFRHPDQFPRRRRQHHHSGSGFRDLHGERVRAQGGSYRQPRRNSDHLGPDNRETGPSASTNARCLDHLRSQQGPARLTGRPEIGRQPDRRDELPHAERSSPRPQELVAPSVDHLDPERPGAIGPSVLPAAFVRGQCRWELGRSDQSGIRNGRSFPAHEERDRPTPPCARSRATLHRTFSPSIPRYRDRGWGRNGSQLFEAFTTCRQ